MGEMWQMWQMRILGASMLVTATGDFKFKLTRGGKDGRTILKNSASSESGRRSRRDDFDDDGDGDEAERRIRLQSASQVLLRYFWNTSPEFQLRGAGNSG
jgi:hypothetical protein